MSNPSSVAPGDTFSYEISLMNPSATDREVMLSDPLPTDVAFVSASAGMVYDPATHTVTWDGVLPGSSISSLDFEIMVTADAGLPEGTWLWNTATVFGKYNGQQLTTLTATTMIDDGQDPDVMVEKTVDKLIGQVGTELNFTIVVGNDGDEPAMDVYVMDVLPEELDYVEGSVTGGATYTDGVIEWQGDLPAGSSHEITFQATINDDAHEGLAIINAAESWSETPFTTMMDYNSSITHVKNVTNSMIKIYLPLISN